MKNVLLSLCLIAFFFGCSGEKDTDASVPVVDLRRDLAIYKDLDSLARDSIRRADGAVLDAFMAVVSGEPVTDEIVEGWSNSLQVAMFTPPTDSVFPTTETVSKALGSILRHSYEEGLGNRPLSYAAVVYGRPESILFVDSVMLIALNHYLGADFPGYSHLPSYMRELKNKDMMPYDLAEALVATSYPCNDTVNRDVLSRILYEGALTHAKMRLVDDADLGKALGYSAEQLKWLDENEARLWRTLVGRNLLYDTSEGAVIRLLSPAPTTRDLDAVAPGRAGRYIGYRIVESYLKGHPGTSLSFILSPEFTADRNTLAEAAYNPS